MPKTDESIYVVLTKTDESGHSMGRWYLRRGEDTILAMQVLDSGEHNQRTMIYLNGNPAILSVKETPSEIEKLQRPE